MTNKLTHHPLTAELVDDGHSQAILLTQQNGIEEPQSVLVHPWQLRAVCEQFGIIASDTQAAKTIATLQRRMLGLRERIDELYDWMLQFSDHRHADLSHEMTSLDALRDLAGEWCADFEKGLPEGFGEAQQPQPPQGTSTKCTSAPAAAQAALL